MVKVTRRQAIAGAVAGGLAAAAVGNATRADDKSSDKVALTTPELILKDKVTGEVRVKFVVEGWVEYQGATVGPGEAQTLILKDGRVGDDRLDVVVDQRVFSRLSALGIDDPKKHFVGKTVVVAGKVYRNKTPGGTSIILWLNEPSQIESIAKK